MDQKHTDKIEVLYNYCMCLFQLGIYEQCLEWIEKGLGLMKLLRNEITLAIKELRVDLTQLKGLCNMRLGRYRIASTDFRDHQALKDRLRYF